MKTKDFDMFWDKDSDNYNGLIQVIDHLKTEITEDMKDDDDDTPYMQITISNNSDLTTWSYQSGDNSYTGSCYGDPFWGVGYICKDSDSYQIANDLISDLFNNVNFED